MRDSPQQLLIWHLFSKVGRDSCSNGNLPTDASVEVANIMAPTGDVTLGSFLKGPLLLHTTSQS